MNFTQLVAEVVRETNRPDLGFVADGGDGRIPSAVLSSTITMHGVDTFYRDIVTAQIKFDAAAYIQTLDLRVLPRYRQLAYVRKWDPTLQQYQLDPNILPPLLAGVDGRQPVGLELNFLEPITPTSILDTYGTEKFDVYYAAGDTLFCKSSTALLWALVGFYQWPFLDYSDPGTNYSSWIADNHPFAIVYHAASQIFTKTGQQDISRKYDSADPRSPGLVQQQIEIMRMSNTEAQGR